ncbi:MAG: hypothetical protein EOP06_01220 [Proteobacteria bacterium]|nr:MAG: hypothetical protein EOP06_01220 [Pseudomonadota bacterium]
MNSLKSFYILFLFFAVTACSGSSKTKVTSPGFEFNPKFKGGSKPEISDGQIVVPANLTATATSGKVTLKWQIPKIYRSKSMNIGYKIFRAVPIFEADDPTSTSYEWSFDSSSPDRDNPIGSKVAATCSEAGECLYEDFVAGPTLYSYAVVSFIDLKLPMASKPRFASVEVRSEIAIEDLSYGAEMMDLRPAVFIGRLISDLERVPNQALLNFVNGSKPLYLLDASETSATAPAWRLKAPPMQVGFAEQDGLNFYVPDNGWERGALYTRGEANECSQYPAEYIALCESLLYTREFYVKDIFGQKIASQYLPRAAVSPPEAVLPESRKFTSRSMSVGYGPSGKKYIFVADKARILVRYGDISACSLDPGEEGDIGHGAEGHCGFNNSIGTVSPRMSCPFLADGSQASSDGVPCTDADMEKSLADSTPPTNFSLRYPSAPVVNGADLIIPDTGNARVLVLENFETKLETCGRLSLLSKIADSDSYCSFTAILGQYVDSGSPFETRSCIRGGEQGGLYGATPSDLSSADPLDPANNHPYYFIDPLNSFGSGGAACRYDRFVTGDVWRRHRLAADFKDESRTHISATTGLLSEFTRRGFRAPTQVIFDSTGKMFITDIGFTIAQTSGQTTSALLPPRIMVWEKNPFKVEVCTPIDPMASTPSCSLSSDGICAGLGCSLRTCVTSECNASYVIGQPAALYGFVVPYGEKFKYLEDTKPSGYFPIWGMAYADNSASGMHGLWAIAGLDSRFFHWKTTGQTVDPEVLNDPLIPVEGTEVYRAANYCGLSLNVKGGLIMGWDCTHVMGLGWRGKLKTGE